MRIANHTHPTTSIVAFCPDCLTYGTPLGPDVQCGNCNGTKCRLYREFEEFKELGRMLPFPQPQSHEKDRRIAELEAEVERLKKAPKKTLGELFVEKVFSHPASPEIEQARKNLRRERLSNNMLRFEEGEG